MKVYREHRGGLAESLATTMECPNGLEDIKKKYLEEGFWTDVWIDEFVKDARLPEVWGGGSYYVMGAYNGEKVCIGMCNFKE